MINSILNERYQGHYGLEYVLAKQNRIAKKEKKIQITPMWRETLKRELATRMRIRRRKEKERRQHIYK